VRDVEVRYAEQRNGDYIAFTVFGDLIASTEV